MHTGVLGCCLIAVGLLVSILPLKARVEDNDVPPDVPAVLPSVTPAEAERLIGGVPRVTIAVKDTPLGDVVARLKQQSGLDLQLSPPFRGYRPVDPKQLVSFEANAMLLWDAVRTLEEKASCQIVLVQNGIRTPHNFTWSDFPESVRTPLYFLSIVRVSRTGYARHFFASSKTERSEQFSLEGALTIDPRLHHFASTSLHIDEIVDDKGGSLLEGSKDVPNDNGSQSQIPFAVGLKSRPDMGRHIARFKGVISSPVSVKHEVWEIPNAPDAAGASKTVHTNIGDLTCKIASVRIDKISDYIEYTFSMNGPAANTINGNRMFLIDTLVTAFSADGKILSSNRGGRSNIDSGNVMKLIYSTKQADSTPARFSLTLPVDIRNMEIPFDFKDVELPPAEQAPKAATELPARDIIPALSIEEALARSGKAPLMTLQFKETPLEEVAAELSRQSGIPIIFRAVDIARGNFPVISVDVQQQPFWTALRAVMAACKLRFAYYASTNSRFIMLFPDTEGLAAEQWQEPSGASGHSLFTAQWAMIVQNAVRTYPTKESRVSRPLRIRGHVSLPPQLSGIPESNRLRLDEALDDQGKSLLLVPGDDDSVDYNGSPHAPAASLRFEQEIILQSREGSRVIRSLKGALLLDVAIRTETWEIPDVLKTEQVQRTAKVVRTGETYELTYTVDKFALNETDFRFRIRVVETAEGQKMSGASTGMLSWFAAHTQLIDNKGYTWQHFDHDFNDVPSGYCLNVRYSRQYYRELTQGLPDKLVLTLPTEIRLVGVPFEFKDLPLP